MAHPVKCFLCGKTFDRDKIPFKKINERRYAHIDCTQEGIADALAKEQQDKDAFYQLVKQIYGKDYNYMLINTQAVKMQKEHGYTWSGMAGCLHWFYNINHGSLEDGHGGIGIIPFIYDECRKYYEKIYKAQEENKNRTARSSVIEFNIQSPRSWSQSPLLLNLEEENNNDT